MLPFLNRFKIRIKSSGPFEYLKHGNIVLHEYKAVYFFVPKVASSSLKILCSEILNIPSPDPENSDAFPHKRHYPYIARDHINLYKDYFKFTIVRNPYSRLLSCYKNKILNKKRNDRWYKNGIARGFKKYGNLFYSGMSFHDFVVAVSSIEDEQSDEHFKSQYLFLPEIDNKVSIDFIGKFENLSDDINTVLEKLNISNFYLPHLLNTSTGNNYRDYYSDFLISLVKKRYQKDIQLFNYSF